MLESLANLERLHQTQPMNDSAELKWLGKRGANVSNMYENSSSYREEKKRQKLSIFQ